MSKALLELVSRAKQLIHEDHIYDQDQLFDLLKNVKRTHYSVVRRAIHIAKTGIFR